MNYPFWDQPVGYGLLMALISVLHVFISHFAVGGGLYLVIAETSARKANDVPRLEYLRHLSKFFVLVTLVLGALTGVAIWFVIGLLAPAATDLLIHNFVWGWATEWTFFVIEIAAALIYYYGWKTMSAANHLKVGWIYFGAAWLSLVIINCILAFMLTPGGWLESGSFWEGFFNPTYFSSTVFRTGVAILMAGLFATMFTVFQRRSDFRVRMIRYNAIWGLVGLAIMAPSFWWYWKSIPAEIITTAYLTMATPISMVNGSFVWAAVIAVLLLILGIIMPRWQNAVGATVLMVAGLMYFGDFEWFRESVRKPWIVTGYMYGNGMEVAMADKMQTDGILAHLEYTTDNLGRDLFNQSCRSCHTMSGYKALSPVLDGTDADYIEALVLSTHALRGNMPPFMGTAEEAGLVAAHIYENIDQRPLAEITGLTGAELGERVYRVRCGTCHVPGGWQDVTASLTGLAREDYEDLLDVADEFAEEMPAFTGDDSEREALIDYLLTLPQTEEGGSNAGL